MKLSVEQFEKAWQYLGHQKSLGAKLNLTKKEKVLLQELIKQMPERTLRHLNYQKIRQSLGEISSREVAKKLFLRHLTDQLVAREWQKEKIPTRGKK